MVNTDDADRRFRPVVHELVIVGARLAGIGLVAIGVSGLIAWAMGAMLGRPFVAGDAPGVTYTAARCREFFEYAPHAPSCARAAADHHFGEIVSYRIVAGLVGGVVIAFATWLRHRRGPIELLPETLVPTVAATAFGIAGVGLAGLGLDLVVLNVNSGGGGFLSGSVVALALAAWFSVPVVRSLAVRRPGPATTASAAAPA